MDLKIGDIKKFNISGMNLLGVVTNLSHARPLIYTAEKGEVVLSRDATYCSARLTPELRSNLEQIGEACKEEIRLGKALENQKQETEKLKVKLRKSLGVLIPEDFVLQIKKSLSENMQEKLQKNNYSLRGYSPNFTTFVLTIERDLVVDRVSADSCSFIYMEYDRSLHIIRDSEDYKKTVAQCHKGDLCFKAINLKNKCKTKEHFGLWIGDKDYLSYHHSLEIELNTNQLPLNKESAHTIASLIKVCY